MADIESSRKRKAESTDEAESDSDVDSCAGGDEDSTDARLAKLKREKRLKMNRESAKKRRENQKRRLNELEAQVDHLNKKNQHMAMMNETLSGRVNELESELSLARSTITMLSGQARHLETNSSLLSVLAARQHAADSLVSQAALGDLLRHRGPQHNVGPSAAIGASVEALLSQTVARGAHQNIRDLSGLSGLGLPSMRSEAHPVQIRPQSTQNTVSASCVSDSMSRSIVPANSDTWLPSRIQASFNDKPGTKRRSLR